MPAAFFLNDSAYFAPEAQASIIKPKTYVDIVDGETTTVTKRPPLFIEVGELKPAPIGHTFGLPGGLPDEFMRDQNPVACKVYGSYEERECPIIHKAIQTIDQVPKLFAHYTEEDWRYLPADKRSCEFSCTIIFAGDVPNGLNALLEDPGFRSLCDDTNVEISLRTAEQNYRRALTSAGYAPLLEAKP